jgi:hypothetical protein
MWNAGLPWQLAAFIYKNEISAKKRKLALP